MDKPERTFTIKVSAKPQQQIGGTKKTRTAQLKQTAIKKRRKSTKAQLPDSDEDESLNPVEEHLIFRLPTYTEKYSGYAQTYVQAIDALREMIKTRSVAIVDSFKVEFKDLRRALVTFVHNGQTFKMAARMIDLPNIIEAQRSFDRRQFHKISDICQLLEVQKVDFGRQGNSEDAVERMLALFFAPHPIGTSQLQIDQEYLGNSGITPPMKLSRVRRFRKRVSKRTVESIEREVARLMKEDSRAEQVEGVFIDGRELEERLNRDNDAEADGETVDPMAEVDDSDDGASSVVTKTQTEQTSDSDEEEDVNNEAVIEGVEGINEEDDDIEIEEESDPDLRAMLQQLKLQREAMAGLAAKVAEKEAQRDDSKNAVLQKRFDGIVQRLKDEMDRKAQALQTTERRIDEFKVNRLQSMESEQQDQIEE